MYNTESVIAIRIFYPLKNNCNYVVDSFKDFLKLDYRITELRRLIQEHSCREIIAASIAERFAFMECLYPLVDNELNIEAEIKFKNINIQEPEILKTFEYFFELYVRYSTKKTIKLNLLPDRIFITMSIEDTQKAHENLYKAFISFLVTIYGIIDHAIKTNESYSIRLIEELKKVCEEFLNNDSILRVETSKNLKIALFNLYKYYEKYPTVHHFYFALALESFTSYGLLKSEIRYASNESTHSINGFITFFEHIIHSHSYKYNSIREVLFSPKILILNTLYGFSYKTILEFIKRRRIIRDSERLSLRKTVIKFLEYKINEKK